MKKLLFIAIVLLITGCSFSSKSYEECSVNGQIVPCAEVDRLWK